MTRGRTVGILADDLIWASRLSDAVRAAGREPRRFRRLDDLGEALEELDLIVVDLTALAYDGVEAIARAAGPGRRVLAVGQHDDVELRRRALDAGAERVFAYRKLFEDGPATLARWIAAEPATTGQAP